MKRLSYSPEQKVLFHGLFLRPLQDFWDGFTGFDVIKFDDEVILSGDGCMRDKVAADYGEEAADFIEVLIRIH